MNISRVCVAGLWIGLVCAASAFALPPRAHLEGGFGAGGLRTTLSQTNDDGKKVIIELQDGKVSSATVNGKQVESKRIKIDGDEIVILGEDGKELWRLSNPDAAPGGARAMMFGPSRAGLWSGTMGQQEIENARKQVRDALKSYTFRDGDQAGAAMGVEPKVMLGVTLGEVGEESPLAMHFGLQADQATLLTGVSEDLPAGKAGLKPFDIVVALDGKSPMGMAAFREGMSKKNPDDNVTLTVISAGQKRDVTIKLIKFDKERLGRAFPKESMEEEDTGNRLFVQPPAAPGTPPVPTPPGASKPRSNGQGGGTSSVTPFPGGMVLTERSTGRERDLEKKLEKLNERLERLEELLQKLADKKP